MSLCLNDNTIKDEGKFLTRLTLSKIINYLRIKTEVHKTTKLIGNRKKRSHDIHFSKHLFKTHLRILKFEYLCKESE